MKYEMIREIFNSCSGNQMRDVFVREVETDDVESIVQQYCVGASIQMERNVTDSGDIVYDLVIDGLRQRISFTQI